MEGENLHRHLFSKCKGVTTTTWQKHVSHTLVQLNGAHVTGTGFGRLSRLGGIAAHVLINWAFVGAMQNQKTMYSFWVYGSYVHSNRKLLSTYLATDIHKGIPSP